MEYAAQEKEKQMMMQPIEARDFQYAATLLSSQDSTTLELGEQSNSFLNLFLCSHLFAYVIRSNKQACFIRRIHHIGADASRNRRQETGTVH